MREEGSFFLVHFIISQKSLSTFAIARITELHWRESDVARFCPHVSSNRLSLCRFNRPSVCLRLGFSPCHCRRGGLWRDALIDARALPELDSLGQEGFGMGSGRQDAISASKSPCLKMTAGKRIRAIMPFSS